MSSAPSHLAPGSLLRRHGLSPKKSWGQNFLGDPEILGRIAAACSAGEGDTIIELGAGLGHLTCALADTGARVVAVERDRELVALLEKELSHPGIELVAADAASVDFAALAKGASRPPIIAGNLPYHLTSSILFRLIEQRGAIARATFLIQREVAERLSAAPGGRDYGILSVLLQSWASVELLFDVPAESFLPPPRVQSSVIRITPLPPGSPARAEPARHGIGWELYEALVKRAFSQRRKTLHNALRNGERGYAPQVLAAAFGAAGIEPTRRAETLTPLEYLALLGALQTTRQAYPQ